MLVPHHVLDSPDVDVLRREIRPVLEPAYPEVTYLAPSLCRQQHVVGLEVAVDHSRVQIRHGVGDVNCDPEELLVAAWGEGREWVEKGRKGGLEDERDWVERAGKEGQREWHCRAGERITEDGMTPTK